MSDKSEFSVPEPPVEIGSGFLTEYWQSKDPLPRVRGVALVFYYLQRGFNAVAALPMSSFITVVSIGVSLFLLAGFMLLLLNVSELISRAGNNLSLSAYLKSDVSTEEVNDFLGRMELNERVRGLKYTSKEDALRFFKEALGSKSGFLLGLDEDNPLPSSIDIFLKPDEKLLKNLPEFLDEIRRDRVVEELVYGSEWVSRAEGVLRVFHAFAFITLLLVLAIIVFLMANTIKLVIYSRRDEIAIMKLVGASDHFIKIPFMIGGVLQGLVGATLGLLLLKLGFTFLDMQVRNSSVLGVALPNLVFLDFKAMLVIILVAVAVGALGSLFALGRFIDV